VDITVSFHHCDPLGVVWHGRYFEYFEVAREALFASLRLGVPDVSALGFRLYVTEVRCRYMVPLALGQRARITTWIAATGPLIRVAHDIRREDARWCARATTVLATTDAAGTLLPRTPDAILERLPVR
jgi:acyl-CoA thioester hydrolase